MRQDLKVSQVTEHAIVFEGPTGHLALSLADCRITYREPREAIEGEEAESEAISVLSIFFQNDEGFLFYEMREP
jgi:hypothetical protein